MFSTRSISVWAIILVALFSCKAPQPVTETEEVNTAPPPVESRNNIDLTGTYTGKIGNSKEKGTGLKLELFEDGSYTLTTTNSSQAKGELIFTGKYGKDKSGSLITLTPVKLEEVPTTYKVSENKLIAVGPKTANIAQPGQVELVKSTAGITEKYWKLTSLGKRTLKSTGEMKQEPHLVFHQQKNRVSGSTGCNSIMGTFKIIDENQIRISELATSKMACENMSIEQELVKNLAVVDSYKLSGESMILFDKNGTELAAFKFIALQ